MKRNRKLISILLTLSLLVTLLVPMASAASDPVSFSSATANGLTRNASVTLGWIKGDIDQTVDTGHKIYVTVELPDGVEWATNPTSGATHSVVVYGAQQANAAKATVKAVDDNYVTVEIPADIAANNFWVQFPSTAQGVDESRVIIDDSAADNINVKVTAKQIDGNGFTVWTQSGEFLVGTLGDAKVTVTAESPKLASFKFFADKTGSKIVLTENVVNALTNATTVTIKLPKNYQWNFANNASFAGAYGLTLTLTSGNNTREAVFTVSGNNRIIADTVKITPVFQILPGAVEGDVVVGVTSTDADVKDADVTIAKFGGGDLTLSVIDSSDLVKARISTDSVTVNNIKLKSDLDLAADDTVELALPEGFEFAAAPTQAYMKNITLYGGSNNNTKAYMAVNTSAKEYVISNIQIKVKPDAPVGPLNITVSGTAGAAGTLQVAEVKPRASATATAATVKIGGLKEAAGNITIKEDGKDTFFANGSIVVSLPAGVKFADVPKYSLNGADATKVTGVAIGDTSFTLNAPQNGYATNTVDEIVFSNLKYDIDTRVASDIEVKINGGALCNIANNTDAVLKVVNATTISATKRDASFVIGSTTYKVNGVEKTMDVAPYIKSDRTFMPVRFVANALGVSDDNILWDGVKQTVTIIKGDRVVQMTIGSTTMLINGAAITMDVAPEITSDRTMLPFRFIAQALGASVNWDEATKTVTMNVL